MTGIWFYTCCGLVTEQKWRICKKLSGKRNYFPLAAR